jgi:hypothetical protein
VGISYRALERGTHHHRTDAQRAPRWLKKESLSPTSTRRNVTGLSEQHHHTPQRRAGFICRTVCIYIWEPSASGCELRIQGRRGPWGSSKTVTSDSHVTEQFPQEKQEIYFPVNIPLKRRTVSTNEKATTWRVVFLTGHFSHIWTLSLLFLSPLSTQQYLSLLPRNFTCHTSAFSRDW